MVPAERLSCGSDSEEADGEAVRADTYEDPCALDALTLKVGRRKSCITIRPNFLLWLNIRLFI